MSNLKLSIHSDLHTEWYNQSFWYGERTTLIISEDTDYLILAGDIGNRETVDAYFSMLRKQYPYIKIIYVLGNHELYGGIKELVIKDYQEISKKHNIIMLENNIHVDEEKKVVFYGAILWSNFKLGKNKEKSMEWANDFVSDFKYIKKYDIVNGYATVRNIHPKDIEKDFEKCIRKIKNTFKNDKFKNYKKVVITHFLPSRKLIAPQHKNMITSSYWTSDIPKIVGLSDLWIYGHSHDNINHELIINDKKIPIICNQQGYVEDINKLIKTNQMNLELSNGYRFDYFYQYNF